MGEKIGENAPQLDLSGSIREEKREDIETFIFRVSGRGFDEHTIKTGRHVEPRIRLDRHHQTKAKVVVAEFKDDEVLPKLKLRHGSVPVMADRIGHKLLEMRAKWSKTLPAGLTGM